MRHQTIVSAMAFFLIAATTPALSQTNPPSDLQIVEASPLWVVAGKIQACYGKVVSYEDPRFTYAGEFALLGDEKSPVRDVIRQAHRFDMSGVQGICSAPKLDISSLSSVIQAFNAQNLGARFRVAESDFGFHIIPTEVRDVRGEYTQASPVLDTLITVPTAPRTVYESIQAICAAVTQSAGVAVIAREIGFDIERLFVGAGDRLVTWGIGPVSAREALIDLLKRSATTLSWSLWWPTEKWQYRLELDAIQLAVTNRKGKPTTRLLMYDRCTKCPNYPPPPPEDPPEAAPPPGEN